MSYEDIFSTHPDLLELQAKFPPADTPRHEQIFQAIENVAVNSQVADAEPARSLEEGVSDDWVDSEEYSHSTRMIAVVGSLAVKGALQTPEGILAKETLRERFESSLIEMLHTDHEFRRKLEINRERKHVVRGGKIMALDGKTSMTGITSRGARSARLAAEPEPAMVPVAERCAADERVAKRVEKLPVGGLLVGVSVDPKEAMARYGKKFYEDKGFREGLAFLQWYYRIDEHTLLAATYSVDQSDLATWREVWAEFGREIPHDEVTDTWLDHDIQRMCTEEQARNLVRQIRDRFYQKRGITQHRYSVDEFMALNQAACDELFESLYMNLPLAHVTKHMDSMLGAFVDGLLLGARDLNKDIRRQLRNMRASDRLVPADIALLEQLVRYAVTEQLRKGLALLGGDTPPIVKCLALSGAIQPEQIATVASGNVLNGARAGRNYGGCTKSINPGDPGELSDRPQDAFGGKEDEGGRENWKWKRGICQVSNCPTRPNATMVGPCSVCWNCQKKFDNGMDLTRIVEEYGKRTVAKVEQLAERTLKPFTIEGLAQWIAESADPKKKKRPV